MQTLILNYLGLISKSLHDISEFQGLKKTSEDFVLRWNRKGKNYRKLGYVHAGRNIAYSDTGKKERAGYANFDFDLFRLDFQELVRYFRVPGTLKREYLVLQWNGQAKNNRKLSYVHADRHRAYADTGKKHRPGYANFDFDLPSLDFDDLGRYFRVPETLN